MTTQYEKIKGEIVMMAQEVGIREAANYFYALVDGGIINKMMAQDIIDDINKTSTKLFVRV